MSDGPVAFSTFQFECESDEERRAEPHTEMVPARTPNGDRATRMVGGMESKMVLSRGRKSWRREGRDEKNKNAGGGRDLGQPSWSRRACGQIGDFVRPCRLKIERFMWPRVG